MTNQDLENVYKVNLPTSHFAGLRGVFDAGVAYGQGLVTAAAADVSLTAPATTVTNDTPVVNTP